MPLRTLPKRIDSGNLCRTTVDLAVQGSYQCRVFNVLLIILVLLLPAGVHAAQTGTASPVRPAEYMIYQYPGVDLVVKIDAPEVEFESKIYGPEQALLKSSGVPFQRIGPLYQLIDAADSPRQLMVKVTPGQKIDRSRISLELIQLAGRDRNSPAFAQAYKLLSYGTETVSNDATTTWSSKAYNLMNASRAFAGLGWEEMRLWAEYFAAHLVLHQVKDELTAIEMAGEIRKSADRAGFEEIQMAALLLESDALLQGGFRASARPSESHFQRVHDVLAELADLSDQLGYHSEQARALFNDGLAWEQQGQPERAIDRFQGALDVALAAGDTNLADEIRGTAAMTYEAMGKTSGAIELLEGVGTDIRGEAVDTDSRELAENLFEKGRILSSTYRYREAQADLSRALALQRSIKGVDARGPIGLALAWTHYSLGEYEQSASLLLESLPKTSMATHRAERRAAYGWLASIYRQAGQFEAMAQYRDKQETLLRSDSERSAFLLERGLDALAREGPASSVAGQYFSQSSKTAAGSGDSLAAQRAQLYFCLNRINRSRGQACNEEDVRRAHGLLSRSGIPRMAVESEFLLAQILRRQGRQADALAGMENLMRELFFLRQALPGVLGAWYWQSRTGIFREYMAATLDRVTGRDGRPLLLALDHVRLLDSLERADADGRIPGDLEEAVRTGLARRESPGAGSAEDHPEHRLEELREQFRPSTEPLDIGDLDRLLGSLSKKESVLTYYFGEPQAFALVGRRGGVRLTRLAGARDILALLREIRQVAGRDAEALLPQLDELGNRLVEPLSERLTERVYFQPIGPLNGFPFDAIRLRGQFLAQQLELVNLLSLPGLESRHQGLAADFGKTVFLAGNPQAGQRLFSYDVAVSAEITAVTDRFVGPGLHIVQGVALTREEFNDERVGQAGLIHLAMPGTLDPAFPDRSRLRLSADAVSGQGGALKPADIRQLDFRASLVVLSATRVAGNSETAFDSGMGFVSDFLESGAAHAITAIWPASEKETTRFVGEFYDRLLQSGDVVVALTGARRSAIDQRNLPNLNPWAGFQLYIR
jgi:tetratricopeptide (TPR) repeat protein